MLFNSLRMGLRHLRGYGHGFYRVVSGECQSNLIVFYPGFRIPANLAVLGLSTQNWLNGINECLNDGNQPAYMNADPAQYLFDTQEQCCDRYFAWDRRTCLGSVSSGTSKWYMDWLAEACVMDCPITNGGSCGGLKDSWEDLWASKSECCTVHKSWDSSCLSN